MLTKRKSSILLILLVSATLVINLCIDFKNVIQKENFYLVLNQFVYKKISNELATVDAYKIFYQDIHASYPNEKVFGKDFNVLSRNGDLTLENNLNAKGNTIDAESLHVLLKFLTENRVFLIDLNFIDYVQQKKNVSFVYELIGSKKKAIFTFGIFSSEFMPFFQVIFENFNFSF
jgi:hypothetical protein